MFKLEQSISEWREQMLAAGIQSPESLNELEVHLREEIERQMNCGLELRKAFELSVHLIGRPEYIGREFKKCEGATVKTIGYVALGIGTLILLRLLTLHLVVTPTALTAEQRGDWRSVLGFLSGQIDAAQWRPNEQNAWMMAAAAIVFFGLCNTFFYFESGDSRNLRLWKIIGILYSSVAVWIAALPVWLLLTVPRYGAAVGVTERILVFAGLAVTVLSIPGWKKCRGLLPLIPDQRSRRLAGIGGCVLGILIVAMAIIFLRPVHFSIGIVLLAWALALASVLGGLGYGLEKTMENAVAEGTAVNA